MTDTASDANHVKADLARGDREYTLLLPFSEWQHCEVPVGRWDAQLDSLQKVSNAATETQLRRAQDLVKQVAAIETGAIEGLYEEDRGFTITAATEVAAFEAALGNRPQKARAYIEAQLRAYDFVLDLATQARPIAEAWIRELHGVICGENATYRVETAVGPQEQRLPVGTYKVQPNHVKLESGEIHSYAPVEQTPSEMQRLVDELRSPIFLAAHPILQSSYSHYGVVWIHPFADGNGRVARALASIYSYRAASIPILITVEQKAAYLAALRAADGGDRQSFVRFMFEKTIDTMRLIEESLKTAALPELDELVSQLRQVYVTRRGYDHIQLDEAAYRILDAFGAILKSLVGTLRSERLTATWNADSSVGPAPEGFRAPVLNGARRTLLSLSSPPPADVTIQRAHIIYVPTSSGDAEVIRVATGNDQTDIPIREVLGAPSLPVNVEAQLKMFAKRVLADHLQELRTQGQQRVTQQGF